MLAPLGTISFCVLSSTILQALLVDHPGWTLGAVLVVLILAGRAKPVRALGSFALRARENFPGLRPWLQPSPEPVVLVDRRPVPLYRRPTALRRAVSMVAVAVVGIAAAIVVAVVLGASAIWLVGSVTGRLK
jgi:hypothetical protein